MITTAVILAAGRGTRLAELGTKIPKGFICLGTQPIIAESIGRLRHAGITHIVIVTGHLDEHYRTLAESLGSGIELVHNARFAESGSMYSLFAARQSIVGQDFLLLESDLIYEQRSLSVLFDHASENQLLCSGATGSGDEVYVESVGNRLVNLSKCRDALGPQIIGELVGITRISAPLYHDMLASAEVHFRHSLRMEYEQALAAVSGGQAIECRLISDLLWAEIDDVNHLERARNHIYPRIVAFDQSPQT